MRFPTLITIILAASPALASDCKLAAFEVQTRLGAEPMNFGLGTTRFKHPEFREIQVSCDGASLDHIWISAYGVGLSPVVADGIDKLATVVWPSGALGTGRRAAECLRQAVIDFKTPETLSKSEVSASTSSGMIQCTFGTIVGSSRPFISVTLARKR